MPLGLRSVKALVGDSIPDSTNCDAVAPWKKIMKSEVMALGRMARSLKEMRSTMHTCLCCALYRSYRSS